VEVSALKPSAGSGLRGASPLLRLQPDERLIALTRRGQHAAFETLFSRYHARLLSFCRHMLGSREDAEDVLQEVFAAAFNAVLADERAINVRPWLYRIARNRSLNHLRRASAVGVDSMDVHFADGGLSAGEQVLRREDFRQLIGDVQRLPETQRTALLLREIDALSYEQIAQTMETTVPSVKSLLVRARISLAEAAEARRLSCEEVRGELGEVAEGLAKISPPARRHLRDCERCRTFRKLLKDNNHALAAILPVGPLVVLKHFALTKFGASSAAGHAAGASSAGAGVGAAGGATSGAGAAGGLLGAGTGAAGGAGATGGIVTAGAGAIATKAAATLAAAALVTAGAVAVSHPARIHRHRSPASISASAAAPAAIAAHIAPPLVVRSMPQPTSVAAPLSVADGGQLPAARVKRREARKTLLGDTLAEHARTHTPPLEVDPSPAQPPAPTSTAAKPPVAPAATVQVTTETAQLPPASAPAATTAAAPASTTPPAASSPAASTTPTGTTTTGTTATEAAGSPTTAADAPETQPATPSGPAVTGESGDPEAPAGGEPNPTTAPNPIEAAGGAPGQ
jgi:RNA polymerase sigma factor (sigma-70 family)